jgi:hypothetical protein
MYYGDSTLPGRTYAVSFAKNKRSLTHKKILATSQPTPRNIVTEGDLNRLVLTVQEILAVLKTAAMGDARLAVTMTAGNSLVMNDRHL